MAASGELILITCTPLPQLIRVRTRTESMLRKAKALREHRSGLSRPEHMRTETAVIPAARQEWMPATRAARRVTPAVAEPTEILLPMTRIRVAVVAAMAERADL